MDKKTLYHGIEWGVALAACIWLVWKMATYDDYPALWESLRSMGLWQYTALVLCVALMPVNMSLEAWRWRTLMNGDASLNGAKDSMMHWREAHRQVYYSKLAGLITPWRLGEYPARGLLMQQDLMTNDKRPTTNDHLWPRVLSMGAVGSATMTAAIVIAGIAGLLGLSSVETIGGVGYYMLVGAVLVALVIALALAPRLLRRWATVSRRLILVSLGQSLVRLACWCVQLALVLYALGAIYNLQFTIYNLPVYYLLVTITPNAPIVEVGVRGVWAIALFGSMNAAFAGVLLWAINTLLPCLIWPFLRKNEK